MLLFSPEIKECQNTGGLEGFTGGDEDDGVQSCRRSMTQ